MHLTAGGKSEPLPPWSYPVELRLSEETSSARWIEERLATYPWATVGAIVPEGFEAYARILHPAYLKDGSNEKPVTWASVAALRGKQTHPLVQFNRLTDLGDDPDRDPPGMNRPREGVPPEEVLQPLVGVLKELTPMTPECWFCLWAGFGQLETLIGFDDAPRVEIPGREYLLFSGALNAIDGFRARNNWGDDGPNIWWPEDRAWCVATEIDLDSTYVGGSGELIESLGDEDALEVMPARLEDGVSINSDTINT